MSPPASLGHSSIVVLILSVSHQLQLNSHRGINDREISRIILYVCHRVAIESIRIREWKSLFWFIFCFKMFASACRVRSTRQMQKNNTSVEFKIFIGMCKLTTKGSRRLNEFDKSFTIARGWNIEASYRDEIWERQKGLTRNTINCIE